MGEGLGDTNREGGRDGARKREKGEEPKNKGFCAIRLAALPDGWGHDVSVAVLFIAEVRFLLYVCIYQLRMPNSMCMLNSFP